MTPRHAWHDALDWWWRNRDTLAPLLAAALLAILLAIGLKWAGETKLIDGEPAPAYAPEIDQPKETNHEPRRRQQSNSTGSRGGSAPQRRAGEASRAIGGDCCVARGQGGHWGPRLIHPEIVTVVSPPATTVTAGTDSPQPSESVPAPPIASVSKQAVRVAPPITTTTTVPLVVWGSAGSSIDGRCTQFEPLLTEYAPEGGWDVERMSAYMARESVCCPQVDTGDGWRTTQGGDRYGETCRLSHVAEWNHRSDAGLLQINGINYDPARCKNTCLSVWLETPVTVVSLGDPTLNVRAAARLCEFWRAAGSSCYRPWRVGS